MAMNQFRDHHVQPSP